jgi:hypothetical protein
VISEEEHRLRAFENRVLRRIFGPKGDDVAGEWRKLHNEELYDVFIIKSYSGDQIKRMIRTGYVARMGGRTYMILVEKLEEKCPLTPS